MTLRRVLLAIGAAAFFATAPARGQAPAEPALALQGMDVVSYFKDGGPVKGQAALRHDFDGARYLFANASNKAAFVADPDRYLPQFHGLCTAGLSKGVIAPSDPTLWKIVDGKLYLFNPIGRHAAETQLAETVARAHQEWAKRK